MPRLWQRGYLGIDVGLLLLVRSKSATWSGPLLLRLLRRSTLELLEVLLFVDFLFLLWRWENPYLEPLFALLQTPLQLFLGNLRINDLDDIAIIDFEEGRDVSARA